MGRLKRRPCRESSGTERLLAKLVEKRAVSKELVARLVAWRRPGFSAHLGDRIAAVDKQRLEDTAADLVRNPQEAQTLISRRSPREPKEKRDIRSYSGVIATFVDRLRLSDAEGLGGQRSVEAGSLIGRLGLLRRTANNTELASAFVVSENYFSVLGVAPLRGRSFESIGLEELRGACRAHQRELLAATLRQRPGRAGQEHPPERRRLYDRRLTPHDFVGTSIAAPNFWLPISLEPLVHPGSQRLRDREDPCCRVFGRLAAGVSLGHARAETSLLASQLPHCIRRRSPGPGRGATMRAPRSWATSSSAEALPLWEEIWPGAAMKL